MSTAQTPTDQTHHTDAAPLTLITLMLAAGVALWPLLRCETELEYPDPGSVVPMLQEALTRGAKLTCEDPATLLQFLRLGIEQASGQAAWWVCRGQLVSFICYELKSCIKPWVPVVSTEVAVNCIQSSVNSGVSVI